MLFSFGTTSLKRRAPCQGRKPFGAVRHGVAPDESGAPTGAQTQDSVASCVPRAGTETCKKEDPVLFWETCDLHAAREIGLTDFGESNFFP